MLRSPMAAAARSMSLRASTPPVGFCGELRMMSFVLGVISRAISSTSIAKSRSSRNGIGTGVPPA